jgi:hypothetical protein
MKVNRVVLLIEKLPVGNLQAPGPDRGFLRRAGVGKWWRNREHTLVPPLIKDTRR